MDTTRVEPETPLPGEDHWRWRPDWAAERICTFWYLTVADSAVPPELERYVGALAAIPWLDPVPARWWHLTLTEIGYADDLGDELVAEVARAVAGVVAGHGPLRLDLGPVVQFRTAIALTAGPPDVLGDLQRAVRRCTEEVLGPDRPVVHPQRFRPHLSLGYLNRDVPGAEVAALVEAAPPLRASVPVETVVLAAVTRRDRHYQWSVVDEVRLAR